MVMTVVYIIVAICLGVFFWFWWVAPKDSVPIHLTETELRRLEVQDRLRKTNFQILIALGFAAIFGISMAQFFEAREHWEADFTSKAEQDRLSTFMNAVKLIDDAKQDAVDNSKTNAGIRTLGALGAGNAASEAVQATEILSSFVMLQTKDETASLVPSETASLAPSVECATNAEPWVGKSTNPPSLVGRRPEAKSVVQAAMRMLGDKNLAALRQHSHGAKCVAPTAVTRKLGLEHAILDNTDLSGLDLSCSMLSNTWLRRTSLYGANLALSDLRGARFADYDIKFSPSNRADLGAEISGKQLFSFIKNDKPPPAIKNDDPAASNKPAPPEWQVYRCWISDLRYADLSGSNLEGVAFDGADLRDADFTGAHFSRTDLSRANLEGAHGLTTDMLKHSCAGIADRGSVNVDAQPVGVPSDLIHEARLAPCLYSDEIPGGAKAKALQDTVREADFQTMKEVEEADEEDRKHPQPFWNGALLYSIGLPALAVLAALFLFEAAGRIAQRVLVPRKGTGQGYLPARFPEKTLSYSARDLRAFIEGQQTYARQYRFPILFPLDLLVMVALSASSAYASWIWLWEAGYHGMAYYSVLFPALYLFADLLEDVILLFYLSGYPFDEIKIAELKRVTLLKMLFVSICFVQVAAALILFLLKLYHSFP